MSLSSVTATGKSPQHRMTVVVESGDSPASRDEMMSYRCEETEQDTQIEKKNEFLL